MARTFDSPRHAALREFLVRKRKEAELRQVDLAKRLKRRQDYVSYVETGQKLVEVVEFMEWAKAIGFDAKMPSKPLPKYERTDHDRAAQGYCWKRSLTASPCATVKQGYQCSRGC